MEFVLFLFFLAVTIVFLSAVSYYSRILFFYPREEYRREEIVSLGRALPMEMIRVWESCGNLGLGILVFLGASLLVYLWARIGGIIGSPHYSHSWGNYFFHFPLFFFVWNLTYSLWKPAYSEEYTRYGLVVGSGFGTGSVAKALSSYGAYHEMYFVYSLLLLFLVGFLSAYLWNGERFLGLELPGSKSWEDLEERGTWYPSREEKEIWGEEGGSKTRDSTFGETFPEPYESENTESMDAPAKEDSHADYKEIPSNEEKDSEFPGELDLDFEFRPEEDLK